MISVLDFWIGDRTYIHTHIHTYIHTHTPTHIHSSNSLRRLHTIHQLSCARPNRSTYIHTYTHTLIHTHPHTFTALTVFGGYTQYINFPVHDPIIAPHTNVLWGGRGRITKVPSSNRSLDEELVALALNYTTAYQMLFDVAKVERNRGRTILVHGAAGGVGTAMLQLAREAGMCLDCVCVCKFCVHA